MSMVVLGAIFVDIKGYPSGIYIPGGRNAGRVEYVHGGVSRNIAEDLGNLELRPTFLSVVDGSGTGLDVINRLDRHKVCTRYIRPVPDGLGTWLAVFDNGNDICAAISKRPDLSALKDTLRDSGDEIFSGADSILLEIDMDKEIVKQVFILAKKYRKPVYAAVSNMSIAMERRDFFREVDCLVCNLQEAETMFSERYDGIQPEELADMLTGRIISAGMRALVVTLGERGAVWVTAGGERGVCPALSVHVEDTTGAGDAFFAGVAAGLTLTDSHKQLVSMGAYLVIFPDKKYINTADLTEFGSLENTVVTTETVIFSLCTGDGTEMGNYLTSAEAPDSPANGALWLDTSGSRDVLRRYGDTGWAEVDDTCIRITSTGIGRGFAAGDGVTVSGAQAADCSGSFVLQAVDTDSIVVPGLLRSAASQTAALTVCRSVPDMDYVTECGNRLWGCKYGMAGGRAVNEIYGSKLGDFKNWNSFQGLSTDSYAASRGSDGPFTAAVPFSGSVLFFKEECIERLYLSAAGAHQIVTTQCPGVKRGSHRSAVEVDGTVYYHAPGGVYAYEGSLPVPVSQAWGELKGENAAAGSLNGRYYVSLTDTAQQHHLLVYDTATRLWHRQDELPVMAFAACDAQLYAMTTEGDILCLSGGSDEEIEWLAETGELGLNTPESKYLVRLALRLSLESGAKMQAFVSYNGGATWEKQGGLVGDGRTVRHAMLHIRPRRCRQLRLKLTGTGRCRLYSLSAVYEKGSDGP